MNETVFLTFDKIPAGRLLSSDAAQVTLATPVSRGQNTHYMMETSHWLCGANDKVIKWIGDTLNRNFSRRDVKVTIIDPQRKNGTELSMFGCLLTLVTFPSLDKASASDAIINLSVKAERLQRTALNDVRALHVPPPAKPWKISEFKFEIDGLDMGVAAVQTVEGLSFKQGYKERYVSKDRFPETEPTQIDQQNIVISVPLSRADPFIKWQSDSAQSRLDVQNKKNGRLSYIAQDKTDVMSLDLKNLFLLKTSKSGAMLRVEMAYDQMNVESPLLGL